MASAWRHRSRIRRSLGGGMKQALISGETAHGNLAAHQRTRNDGA